MRLGFLSFCVAVVLSEQQLRRNGAVPVYTAFCHPSIPAPGERMSDYRKDKR